MSDTVEARAREMGWRPQAEYRGDPEKWVDADTYVDRAETVLPIVKADRARLERQLNETRAELRQVREALEGSRESISALEEFYTEETKRQVANARRDLSARIRAARENDDVDTELELQGELTRLNAAEERAKESAADDKKKGAVTKDEPPPLTDAYKAWAAENAWFNTDAKKARRAIVVAQDIVEDSPHLRGKPEFYEELDKRLIAEGVKEGRRRDSKVEGGGGDDGGRPAGNGRSYEDLPADAKAACNKQAKALVGKDRKFKTEAEWRKYYADVFFREY